jgi:hypothetical protein
MPPFRFLPSPTFSDSSADQQLDEWQTAIEALSLVVSKTGCIGS